MLLHILKKDCLLIKKYLLFLAVLAFGFPLFLLLQTGAENKFTYFVVTAFVIQMVAYNTLSVNEFKYAKGEALLCASPYSRRAMVGATYLFNLGMFLYCYMAYTVVAFCIGSPNAVMTLWETGVYVLFLSLMYGIYIPVQYKLGYAKTRFVFMIVIIAVSWGVPLTARTGLFSSTNAIAFPSVLPEFVWGLLAIALAMGISFVSYLVSVKIYQKKEL